MTTPIKLCANCNEKPVIKNSEFCSQLCLELWSSLQQAKALSRAFNMILDEHFGAENADTRPSK